ncbi:hypothetical protein [Cellulomonas phragmiteti]|uniref:PASTA domain-containing protein n=1 Tax=Cellulomonas phragmiteti TaxID=478780 RepID=A0ABQ4DPZ4_9CELL|nr:hypothetical protein [Cellulomonas phragmiteti]GIG41423.1 hypothetical protein Cph01nite_31850 [Cellulomonas phragmiteti]
MSKDLMRRLRAADPAAHVDLRADDAMREAIMTTHATTNERARAGRERRVRRGVLAGGLATVLVGGGAAYAGFHDWYRGTGPNDGISCLSRWDAPEDERSGGPMLTGDPVADCQRYQELTGLPPIEDAVAFLRGDDGGIVVAPRADVPAGAVLLPADPQAMAVQELIDSTRDYVDGLGSACLDESALAAAAQVELDRLGLADWVVRTQTRGTDSVQLACADVWLAVEPWSVRDRGTAADERTLVVMPHAKEDRDSLRGDEVVEVVDEIRDVLRARVAGACVDLDTAERIATEALGEEHHWPTVVIEDPDAACTRVDLAVGGSIQVSLRGPRP